MWHGGTNYPRISRTGVPERGDVGITVTQDKYLDQQNLDQQNLDHRSGLAPFPASQTEPGNAPSS